MIYRNFLGNKVSLLGFGTMRFPVLENGRIDEAKVKEMLDYAIANGVNYFDTAWPYHAGQSEEVLGRLLKEYPRESFFMANKYPGHAVADSYNPAEIFEKQLAKCGVEYFDYYLLHNVYEKSIDTYKDPQWGIIDYFRRQKDLGRIKHLGFSSHGSPELIDKFIEYCEGDMEFCQIQLNYLDFSLQKGEQKYDILTKKGLPIIVIEPLRGGRLLKLTEGQMEKLEQLRPGATAADWTFSYLLDDRFNNISTVLSGMSNMEQLSENIKIFSAAQPLNDAEKNALYQLAEEMKDGVPCTACGYCLEGCPLGLEIPLFLSVYNELKFDKTMIAAMRIEWLEDDKRPSACIKCGKCSQICPQNIDIPDRVAELTNLTEGIPTWVEICRQRDEEMKAVEKAAADLKG